jgi:hypothetical protein
VLRANAPQSRGQGLLDLLSEPLVIDVDRDVAHKVSEVRAP